MDFRSAFSGNGPRIVGGKPIAIDRFPWHLSLRFKHEHRCSASLITINRALTVAHCMRADDNLTDFTIMAGSTTRHPDGSSSIVGLETFLRHPKFDNLTLENDIAILWLSYKLTLGTKINLIKVSIPLFYGRNSSKLNHFIILFQQIPESNANSNKTTTVLISGWGYTREADPNSVAYQLQYAAISLIPRENCQRVYGNHLKESMFCAGVKNGGKDACQGNSFNKAI